jgi:hypothetical protein
MHVYIVNWRVVHRWQYLCNTYCLHIITLLVIKILIRVVVKILVSPTFTWARLIFRSINKYAITLRVWMKQTKKHVISVFRREIDENCALLGYYAASSGNSLPTFRDNISVPPSREYSWPLKMGLIGSLKTSVRNIPYHAIVYLMNEILT